jgi:hypothetical protein
LTKVWATLERTFMHARPLCATTAPTVNQLGGVP